MGYRSDVVALIYPDAETKAQAKEQYAQLKVLMATTFKDTIDGTAGVDGFMEYMTWMGDECVLKFHMEGVKWYPQYADVQMFERMMRDFDGEIDGYCTEFARIGEESDDTEEHHTGENNQYYLQVRRSIDCNV
jgi:tetrahydrodipicolinate N-succinyltransferase